MWKMWNATILEGYEYPVLRKKGFAKVTAKSWESFLHIPSPTWADLRFPHARGLRYHQPFIGSYPIDKL